MSKIQPTSSLPVRSSDLVIVDTYQHGAPGAPKTVPGFHYRLPQVELFAPVRGMIFHGADWDFPPRIGAKAVVDQAGISGWLITLREPDGRYILHQVPCARFFTRNAKTATNVRRLWYFPRTCWPDPLQSYLINPKDVDKVLIPFSFLY
jgi:hypothetical protein